MPVVPDTSTNPFMQMAMASRFLSAPYAPDDTGPSIVPAGGTRGPIQANPNAGLPAGAIPVPPDIAMEYRMPFRHGEAIQDYRTYAGQVSNVRAQAAHDFADALINNNFDQQRAITTMLQAHPEYVNPIVMGGVQGIQGTLKQGALIAQEHAKAQQAQNIVTQQQRTLGSEGHVGEPITMDGQQYLPYVDMTGKSTMIPLTANAAAIARTNAEAGQAGATAKAENARAGLLGLQTKQTQLGIDMYEKQQKDRAALLGAPSPAAGTVPAAPGVPPRNYSEFSATYKPDAPAIVAPSVGSTYAKGYDLSQDPLSRFTKALIQTGSMGPTLPGMKFTQGSPVTPAENNEIGQARALAQTLTGLFDAAGDPNINIGPVKGAIQSFVNQMRQNGAANVNILNEVLGGHAGLSTGSALVGGRFGVRMMEILQNQILPAMNKGPIYQRQAVQQSMRLVRDNTTPIVRGIVARNAEGGALVAPEVEDIDKQSKYVLTTDAGVPKQTAAAPVAPAAPGNPFPPVGNSPGPGQPAEAAIPQVKAMPAPDMNQRVANQTIWEPVPGARYMWDGKGWNLIPQQAQQAKQ